MSNKIKVATYDVPWYGTHNAIDNATRTATRDATWNVTDNDTYNATWDAIEMELKNIS